MGLLPLPSLYDIVKSSTVAAAATAAAAVCAREGPGGSLGELALRGLCVWEGSEVVVGAWPDQSARSAVGCLQGSVSILGLEFVSMGSSAAGGGLSKAAVIGRSLWVQLLVSLLSFLVLLLGSVLVLLSVLFSVESAVVVVVVVVMGMPRAALSA